MRRRKRWIQKAIKKKGTLKNYVKRKYGKRGFTERGTIKVKVGKRARLALTLRKLKK